MAEMSDFENLIVKVRRVCQDFNPNGSIGFSLMQLYKHSSTAFVVVMTSQFLSVFFVLMACLKASSAGGDDLFIVFLFTIFVAPMIFTVMWAKIIRNHYKEYIPTDTDSTILMLKDEAFKPGRLTSSESAELMNAIKESSYGLRLSRNQCKEINDLVLNYSFNIWLTEN